MRLSGNVLSWADLLRAKCIHEQGIDLLAIEVSGTTIRFIDD